MENNLYIETTQDTSLIFTLNGDNKKVCLLINHSINFLTSLEDISYEENINQNLLYFQEEIFNFLIKNKLNIELYVENIKEIIFSLEILIREKLKPTQTNSLNFKQN